MFITGVVDIVEKFIAGVIDNLHFPGVVDIVQKKTKDPKIYRRCQRHRQKLFTGVNDTADKFFGGVSNTGD
jgi:hypothetical protein